MKRRLFLSLLPAAGTLFGMKAKPKAPLSTAARSPDGFKVSLPRGYEEVLEADLRQRAADIAFCHGDQWPAEVRMQREKMGRLCLTINHIPELVQARVTKPTSGKDYEDLVVDTVRKHRDLQVLFNYYASALAELERLT